jgi:hypothetical protein
MELFTRYKALIMSAAIAVGVVVTNAAIASELDEFPENSLEASKQTVDLRLRRFYGISLIGPMLGSELVNFSPRRIQGPDDDSA